MKGQGILPWKGRLQFWWDFTWRNHAPTTSPKDLAAQYWSPGQRDDNRQNCYSRANSKCPEWTKQFSYNKRNIKGMILDATLVKFWINQSDTNPQIGGSKKWRLGDDSAVKTEGNQNDSYWAMSMYFKVALNQPHLMREWGNKYEIVACIPKC